MRRIPVEHHGEIVGTFEVMDSIRPPITQAELDRFPCHLLLRSRSWLFDIRPGDFRCELRSGEEGEHIVIVASRSVGPADLHCVLGFEPAAGKEDPETKSRIDLFDQILKGSMR